MILAVSGHFEFRRFWGWGRQCREELGNVSENQITFSREKSRD
ncbi:hypothetical protein NSP_41080 [Nodularia spumigena CCY9414]|nr:hypothetical protein NSP_41080 [Nodularia spumigena CCY9414]